MRAKRLNKINKILPKRLRARRAGYFALVMLFLVSILSFNLFVLSPKTKALTATSSPGSAAQDASGTVSWTSLANAELTDGAFSTATGTANTTVATNYLQLTNLGFAIPGGSTINGITITFDRFATSISTSNVTDNSVKIIKGGTATGTDHSAGLTWARSVSTPSSDSFGNGSDLWGAAWTTTDINASNFGVELKANDVGSASQPGIANVDGVTIVITYTSGNSAPAAPTLSAPSSGATAVSTAPLFQTRTTDADNDYLKYDIAVYQSNCSTLVRDIDQTSSQTGWSGQDQQVGTAYTGNSTIGSSTMANHTYQSALLSGGTTYCWKARAIDPGGSNTFGSYSGTQLFTTSSTPAAPTLLSPASGATAQSTSPLLQIKTTDPDSDYLLYKILLYNSDCSTGLQTFDQTSSQSGWSGQNQQAATAYTGSTTLSGSTTASYGLAVLSTNTTYCWKAAAIDQGGTNTFSSFSGTQLFTTGSATSQVQINGGTTITGGSVVR